MGGGRVGCGGGGGGGGLLMDCGGEWFADGKQSTQNWLLLMDVDDDAPHTHTGR